MAFVMAVQAEEGAGVTRADLAAGEAALHLVAEAEKAQRVGDGATVHGDALRNLGL